MGTRSSFPPGTHSWADLATSDADAAKGFYSAVFGWTYTDLPIPDGSVYSMAVKDGHDVAAISANSEQPPHWNCYVTVASADDAAAKAAELGGTVVAPPFDVMDSGRMSAIADPQGAVFCVWEPKGHIGAGLVNAPGALTWDDLLVPDPEAAGAFYGELFGWSFEPVMPGQYWTIKLGDRMNGGAARLDPERMPGVPPCWTPYFGHPDVEGLVASVGDHGGRSLFGVREMPEGKIGWFADPQGAVFAVWTGQYED